MPNIPMAILAMLTCARIGAVHNVAHPGEAANELAARLDASEPKLVFTCSGGFRSLDFHERTEEKPYEIVKYAPILEEAFGLATKVDKNIPRIIY